MIMAALWGWVLERTTPTFCTREWVAPPGKCLKSGCLEVYSGSAFFLHTQQILLKVIVHVLARVSGEKL